MVGDRDLQVDKEPHSMEFAPALVRDVWAVAKALNAPVVMLAAVAADVADQGFRRKASGVWSGCSARIRNLSRAESNSVLQTARRLKQPKALCKKAIL